jgi:hypothetical protein
VDRRRFLHVIFVASSALFLLGSICFLISRLETLGIYLLVAGSAGFVVGSIAQAMGREEYGRP